MLATSSTLKLLAVIVPLGLDTLAVSLALGIGGLPTRHRLRVSVLFAVFEAVMPLIGVLLGAPLGHLLGSAANLIAAGLIVVVGIYLIVWREGGEEGESLLLLTRRGLLGALALGLSISLDELAIGFSAGLLELPILPLAIAVGAQAFLAAQVGLRLGARVGARFREFAERLAGIGLILLGVWLLVQQVTA